MADPNRKPTLEDVARSARVSRALVSIVMREAPVASDATRARVREVAERIGYRPDARARLLARSSTRLLGVVYRVNALHHVDLLAPIYDAAEAARYEVILSGRTRSHDSGMLNTLLDYRCEAILMLGPDLEEAEINRVAGSVPVVLAGRRMVHPAGAVDSIRTDEDQALRLAVDHLVGLATERSPTSTAGTAPSARTAGARTEDTSPATGSATSPTSLAGTGLPRAASAPRRSCSRSTIGRRRWSPSTMRRRWA